MARKLRIAVSVFFGVLTVALWVLWVQSYSHGRSKWPISGTSLGKRHIDAPAETRPKQLPTILAEAF